MDPQYAADCERCVQHMYQRLQALGFQCELIHTIGKPLLLATRAGKPALPEVLYYGHYDVQPAQLSDGWSSAPFEPVLRGDRLYCRGALDNKGQTSVFLAALETLLQRNELHCGLKILLEGEEECGSEGLAQALKDPVLQKKLSSSVLMVCDSEAAGAGIPAITVGLRGIMQLSVGLQGAKFDLHSGLHGGAAPNPALGLARLLATLHGEDGSIQVAGFCDRLREPSPEVRALLKAFPFDHAQYEKDFGIRAIGGETALCVEERLAFRPTIEINGLWSGYTGAGHKSIIPARADAKITCRLAAEQDPERAKEALIQHLRAHAPKGFTLELESAGPGHRAFMQDPFSPLLTRAKRVLENAYQHAPVFQWCPASIPIVVDLYEALKAEPLMVGFGLSQDRQHGPDESFSLTQCADGFCYVYMMLRELSGISS
jgi:acetylornithine deacetylase/succinyl-diaminopimelate desuccinylase-like protein